jgi:phosphohistidine phosphatase
MKTLYIVRHAKSSWKYPELSDEERPLLEKGKKRTKKIIDYLLENNVKVDYIITSHAVRALETAKILGHALNYPEDEIKIDHEIYFADSDKLFNQFYDLPDRYDYVMMVGHNPALTNFANFFVTPKIDWLPTSGIVCIEFDTDSWDKVPTASPNTRFVIYPKMLTSSN